MKTHKQPKPPIKPIDHILHSQIYSDIFFHQNPKNSSKAVQELSYDRICYCRNYNDDRPYGVYCHNDPDDVKPYKVVFEWKNPNHESFKFKYHGDPRTEIDKDTYYMYDILEEHSSKSAAQKSMRAFAKKVKASFVEPKKGDLCKSKIGRDLNISVRVGDLVLYECDNFVGEGIVWRVTGEVRKDANWILKIRPVFSATKTFDDRAEKEMARGLHYLSPCDIVSLAAGYSRFTQFINEEKNKLLNNS